MAKGTPAREAGAKAVRLDLTAEEHAELADIARRAGMPMAHVAGQAVRDLIARAPKPKKSDSPEIFRSFIFGPDTDLRQGIESE